MTLNLCRVSHLLNTIKILSFDTYLSSKNFHVVQIQTYATSNYNPNPSKLLFTLDSKLNTHLNKIWSVSFRVIGMPGFIIFVWTNMSKCRPQKVPLGARAPIAPPSLRYCLGVTPAPRFETVFALNTELYCRLLP